MQRMNGYGMQKRKTSGSRPTGPKRRLTGGPMQRPGVAKKAPARRPGMTRDLPRGGRKPGGMAAKRPMPARKPGMMGRKPGMR